MASRDARRIVRNFTLHSVRAIDITTVRQCVGEDQLLDLTLSTTKINHSLHSTAVQMIKNVHFCAKIFTSKVQFRLLLHTQVTKNLKNEIKMIDVCHYHQVYYFVVYYFSVIVYLLNLNFQ